MSTYIFESTGHAGVLLRRDRHGSFAGYIVEGCDEIFTYLADALAARDGPDNDLDSGRAPDLPDPDRPRSGHRR